MKKISKSKNELYSLHGVGPAVFKKLELLGITSIAQLAHANAEALYIALEKITGERQHPCLWDVGASIVHEAKTGEKTPWQEWTLLRKQRTAVKTLKKARENLPGFF